MFLLLILIQNFLAVIDVPM